MNSSCTFGSVRGYSEILLEEIALEGLDGITLETLWKRLQYNPDWKLFPIDDYIEQFIWKYLLDLRQIEWFALPQPRKCPRIFATFDELVDATAEDLDLHTCSSDWYPHFPINDNGIIGSCPSYYVRINVSKEIENLTIAEAKIKWGNKLVIVASQTVRNSVLLPQDENPDLELADTSYFILERIGRARRCGESSLSLNFLKNGANPTFYFWNGLRKRKIIHSQNVYTVSGKTSNTLFHLPQFYKKIMEGICGAVHNIVSDIESSPKKACLFSDMKEKHFRLKPKMTKSEYFKRFLKVQFMDYDEFYQSDDSPSNTPNRCKKVLRVIKLAEQNPEPGIETPMEVDEDETNEIAILKENRFLNKPLLNQCYQFIDESGTEGVSMVDLGRKLGITKLVARALLRSLSKHNLILSLPSEDARKRYFRYFSVKFSEEVASKLRQQLGKSIEIFEMKSEESEKSETFPTSNISSTECDNESRETVRIDTRPKKRKLPSKKGKNAKRKKISDKKISNKKSKRRDTVVPDSQLVIPANQSLFAMRRMNIILNKIDRNQVILRRDLVKIVSEEETKLGLNQGQPDRKSMLRVLKILTGCGKVKIIKKVVTNEARSKSREIDFICLPNVDDSHPMIAAAVQEAKNELAITYVPKGARTLTSNNAKFLYPIAPRKTWKYGYAPKFSRMKLLHEILVYILYQYEGNENLDQEECKKYLSPLYAEDDSASENIPKCYTKEIGWKMFIPPLMKYEEYQDGWLSQNDLTDRLPLKLFFSLIHMRFENPDVDLYLQHPIKKYYLMRHLPLEMQEYLTVDNRYMYSLHLNFRNLCMIGLTQFGPRTKTRGFQNLVYVNKKTQLLDTRSSPPAFMRINPLIDYPRSDYDFTRSPDLERYWNNAMRFCLGTKLGRKKRAGEEAPVSSKMLPDALRDSLKERAIEEASLLDVGDVPGDRSGASGYDSWHYSHFIKQWVIHKTNETTKSATSLKSSKVTNLRNDPKLRRFKNNILNRRNIPSKTKDRNRLKLDNVDAEAIKKLKTLRATWKKNEDEVILLCYVASNFYKPTLFPTYKPYNVYRKILHSTVEISTCKTRDVIKRRMNSLLKNAVRKHNANLLIKEMTESENFKDKFKDTITELEKCIAEKGPIEDVLDKLTEEVFYHLYESKMSVLKREANVSLPNDIETFRQNWQYEYTTNGNSEKSVWMINEELDIVVLVILNLSLSTLLSQVEKDKVLNINFLFSTFRQFDDELIKFANSYLREKRMISYNKYTERGRSAFVPFGKGVYHLSLTYHIILKATYHLGIFTQIFANYLELISKEGWDDIELANYESGQNLMLISLLTSDNINFEISSPECILTYAKPTIIDPSEVSKPLFEARSAYTDETLSLIHDSFFKNQPDLPKEIESKNLNDAEKSDDGDSEPDIGDEVDDIEETQIDYNSSKIAIYITRLHFQLADARSTAYDSFLINPFRLKCNINSERRRDTFAIESKETFLKRLEEGVSFRKIKFTNDELMQKVRKCLRKPNQRDCAISLLEFLRTKGPCGATYKMLTKEFNDISLLKTVTDTLVRHKLLIRNGSQYTHFVHLDFSENWLLRSYKNKNILCDETDDNKAEPEVINRRSLDENDKMNEYCESIWVLIKPWVYLNGTINVPALESFLVRILLFIVKNPGCNLKHIQMKFTPALQPHSTRELVELLQELECIQLKAIVVNRKATLFTKPTYCSVIDCATGYEDEQDLIIEPNVNALVRLSIFIGDVHYKDLLEMKSYDISSVTKQQEEETQNISEIETQNASEMKEENVNQD